MCCLEETVDKENAMLLDVKRLGLLCGESKRNEARLLKIALTTN